MKTGPFARSPLRQLASHLRRRLSAVLRPGPASLFGIAVWLASCAAVEENVAPRPDYRELAAALETWIEDEMRAKGIPALSIALVDDQEIVWATGFGMADPEEELPASAATVYRVGSVSKLFADIAVMQLAQVGRLDIDKPITEYLPELQPHNRFRMPITLRQLMSHRSGLVREPPLGHYFDPEPRTLEETVLSLNSTALVYEPEARIKYSNAAVSAAGLAVERLVERPFNRHVRDAVLRPMGIEEAAFDTSWSIEDRLAKSWMWGYDRPVFAAPAFALGTAPAGNLYASMLDLARFLKVLHARGRGPMGQVLQPETIEEMWRPQFAAPGQKGGFGLGFILGELEGHRAAGHNGAVYGFSTGLRTLPDERLGVAASASLDVAYAVVDRIVDEALRGMLAVRAGRPLPALPRTLPVEAARARALAGRYEGDAGRLELHERGGRLFLDRGGLLAELRRLNDELVTDDRHAGQGFQLKAAADGSELRAKEAVFRRVEWPRPEAVPVRWQGLIGEYGWDHNVLYILEKDGHLHALIEWIFLYPLKEEPNDVFSFPDYGLYHGEKLIFRRDPGSGLASEVEAASVVFRRRVPAFGAAANGEGVFRIEPLLDEAELREVGEDAEPPEEEGEHLEADLVELASLDPTIRYDIRYATKRNFLGMVLYPQARAFLQRPAAQAVQRAHQKLNKLGFGLLIHDAYRPFRVTAMFWEATPQSMRRFVADPAKGSRHNRGCAVDLTLYELRSGQPVAMPGLYDEFTERSHPYYPGGTGEQRWLRDLLRRAMEEEGFTVYEHEWWHFDYRDWQRYGLENSTFEEIAPAP